MWVSIKLSINLRELFPRLSTLSVEKSDKDLISFYLFNTVNRQKCYNHCDVPISFKKNHRKIANPKIPKPLQARSDDSKISAREPTTEINSQTHRPTHSQTRSQRDRRRYHSGFHVSEQFNAKRGWVGALRWWHEVAHSIKHKYSQSI